MRKTVLTFGLISGAIMSAMMILTIPFMDRIGYDAGEIIGYATMVAASLLVYFGVRRYRDDVAGGNLSFGRAIAVGSLIVAVASACYTATWEVIYYNVAPDFMVRYEAHTLEQERAKGATPAELERRRVEAEKFVQLYKNPLINASMTFLAPLPVGLLAVLISAAVLRRKSNREAPVSMLEGAT
jgi:hypothetical protein